MSNAAVIPPSREPVRVDHAGESGDTTACAWPAWERDELARRVRGQVRLRVSDVLLKIHSLVLDAAPAIEQAEESLKRIPGINNSEVKCRVVSHLAGNPRALENNEHGNGVLQVGLTNIDEGAQTTISSHKMMPADRQEHILNSARIRAEELKAVPLEITQLAAEAFLSFGGANHRWLGRPEVLDAALRELASANRDDGYAFEDEVVQWSRRKFPRDVVVASAFMDAPEIAQHNKEHPDDSIKGEVDALVLHPAELQEGPRLLRIVAAAVVSACRSIDDIAQRVLRLQERVERTEHRYNIASFAATAASGGADPEAARRAALVRSLAHTRLFADSQGPMVPPTAAAIVEAKLSTNKLPEDLKKCFALRDCLARARRPAFVFHTLLANGYKEGTEIKTYGKRVANSVPFRMPDKLTAVPIHVCVSECQGGSEGEVSLIDLFTRSAVLQVKSTITELAARKFGPLIGGASGHPTRRPSLSKGSPPERRWTVNGRRPSHSRSPPSRRPSIAGSPPRREPSLGPAPTRMPSEPTRRPSGELRIQSPREIAAGHHYDSGDESERYDDTVSALDVAIEIKSDGFVALVATPPDVVVQNAVDIGVSRVSFAREKMSSGELYYWCFNATPSSSDDTTADEHDFSDRVF